MTPGSAPRGPRGASSAVISFSSNRQWKQAVLPGMMVMVWPWKSEIPACDHGFLASWQAREMRCFEPNESVASMMKS